MADKTNKPGFFCSHRKVFQRRERRIQEDRLAQQETGLEQRCYYSGNGSDLFRVDMGI